MAKLPANLARIKHKDILAQIREATGTIYEIGHWVSTEWSDFDLIKDASSILDHCSMDHFVIGRACWVARKHAQRMIDNYRHWKYTHKEPDWFENPVYLSKPGSVAWVAKERAKYPPDWALKNFASFAKWSYQGEGKLEDHTAIASAVWLLDTLGLTVDQLIDNAVEHGRAWQFGWEMLAKVTVPNVIDLTTPTMPVDGLPVPKEWQKWLKKDGAPMEVLAMILCVKSGVSQHHGRWLFPTVSETNGAN